MHVYSSDNHPLRVESSDAYAGIEIKDNGSATLPPLHSALSNDHIFYGGHASSRPELVRFGSDGKVAINQASLTENLTVNGTGAFSGKFAVLASSVHGSFDFYNNGTSYFNGTTYVDDVLQVTGSSSQIQLGFAGAGTQQANSEALSIITPASGGGQGIGLKRLDSNTDQGLGQITWSNNTQDGIAKLYVKTDGSVNKTAMVFQTAGPTGGSVSEKMRIDNTGKVGISNSSPSALLHVGADGVTVNATTDVSRTAIFRTTGTGNYSSSGNNSASHAATFMRGNAVNTGDQVGHSYVFNNGGWSATAEIMAEVEDNSTAYSRLNFKTWRGGMATRQVITSEGYVVKAYQPYIRCAGNTASMAANQGTTADYSNWANQVQRGITRSGATFTVPIAGEYLITYSFYNWINNSGPNVTHAAYLQKNGSTVQETVAEYDFENDAFSYMDNQLQNSLILNMAAGDTFKFATYADIYGGSTHTNMSAYLLG